MVNLDALFPDTRPYSLEGLPADPGGGHYNTRDFNSSESPARGYRFRIGNDKYVFVDFDNREDGFCAGVCELVTGLTAKPSARIKNQAKWQRERAVWATVAPIVSYNTIADAVNHAAAKLRERYLTRYREPLDVPLEEIITAALQKAGIQPPGEA